MDALHHVVTEARARRQRDESAGGSAGADNWRPDLHPRAAARARTIPALERERDLLRARLAEVRHSFLSGPRPRPRVPLHTSRICIPRASRGGETACS